MLQKTVIIISKIIASPYDKKGYLLIYVYIYNEHVFISQNLLYFRAK